MTLIALGWDEPEVRSVAEAERLLSLSSSRAAWSAKTHEKQPANHALLVPVVSECGYALRAAASAD